MGSLRQPTSFGAFLVGCSVGVSLVASTRVSLWRRNSSVLAEYPQLGQASTDLDTNREAPVLFFGPELRAGLVNLWNKGIVDAVAKPAIEFLAERSW